MSKPRLHHLTLTLISLLFLHPPVEPVWAAGPTGDGTLGEARRHPDERTAPDRQVDFSRARQLERTGKTQEAVAAYRDILAANGVLAPYALRHLADLAHRERDFTVEQSWLKQLLAQFPSSPAARECRARLADSYFESGNLAAAETTYRALASANSDAKAKLVTVLMKAGKKPEAVSIAQAMARTGKDDQTLFAYDVLDQLGPATLAETEHLVRARRYLANRRSDSAIRHFKAVVERFPASTAMAEALYGIGRANFIADRFDEAIVWYDRVHRDFPSHEKGELGFYQAGHAMQSSGKFREAIERYEAFLKEYPTSQYVGGAHLNAIDTLRLAGDFDGALGWCDRTEKRFAGDVTAVTAAFSRAKIYLTQNKPQAALNVARFLQLQNLSRRAPGSTNAAEVAMLYGYCLEQMEFYQEAIAAYLGMPDRRDSYYGQRATERLLALRQNKKAVPFLDRRLQEYLAGGQSALRERDFTRAKDAFHQVLRLTEDETLRRDVLGRLGDAYRNLPAYAAAWKYALQPIGSAEGRTAGAVLVSLGLLDEPGAFETAKLEITDSFSRAVYANRAGLGYLALDYGEATFGGIPGDARLEALPRDVAELLYPAPYREAMVRASRPRRIDPRMLLAVARQESRFRPWVKSPAAARGLFQFIDPTAQVLAGELNLPNFLSDDLYDPPTAVLFGAQYVAGLFKQFPNNPQAVAAAYNGGESGVRRWLQRARSADIDRFTFEVGYLETKEYVAIVMCNYRAYQQVYGRDLN